MAYTSVLPVHRLDRSIDYVKDRAKTTKSAGSLEEAIDYALNREKTEESPRTGRSHGGRNSRR